MSVTTTIDKAGRLVVPKEMRLKLGLHAGSKVRLEVTEDRLELTVDVPEAEMEDRDGIPVIVNWEGYDAAEAARAGRERYLNRLAEEPENEEGK